MLFVLQNPTVRSQSLEKVESKFQMLMMDLRGDANQKIYGICF
jgi:hypothetical protein